MGNSIQKFPHLTDALLHLHKRRRGVPSNFNDRLKNELRLNFVLVCAKDDDHYIDYIKAKLERENIRRFYLLARGEDYIEKAARISRFLRDENILTRGRVTRGVDDTPDGPVSAIVIQMFSKENVGSSSAASGVPTS